MKILVKVLCVTFLIFSFEVHALSKRKYLSQKYTSWSLGLRTWQENFNITSGGNEDLMASRFEGLSLVWEKFSPRRKRLRWLKVYGAQFDLGFVKASALLGSGDRLKNQAFVMASGFYGYKYRTSIRSELGLQAPLAYKHVFWDVEDTLDIKDQSFSIGLEGLYTYRLSLKSTVTFSLTHHFLWDASIWTIRYTRELR